MEQSGDGTSTVSVDTLLFGAVDLTYRDGVVTGRYVDAPHTVVKIRRSGGRTHTTAPIGSRTPADITATIDGRSVTLEPGRAKFVEKSFLVRIEFDERVLTLAAKNLEDSRLSVGDQDRGDNELGALTRVFGGGVEVIWSTSFTAMGRQIDPPVPSRNDALVGIVVAAAFGTGGVCPHHRS